MEAIEITRGNVAGYRCHCGADFDAEILHNFSKIDVINKHVVSEDYAALLVIGGNRRAFAYLLSL